MTSFLSAAYKTTIYVSQPTFSKIKNKERHYFCSKKRGLNVGDVVLIEVDKINGYLELLITCKDIADENIIYGFVSIEDMPVALHNLVSGIFEANQDLFKDNLELRAQNIALLSINENRKANALA